MFIDNLKNELNTSITENGAEGYSTTESALLDFNFKISSYRDKTDEEIKIDFKKIWYENQELALKYLFYVRDAREGLGERRLFRTCVTEIVDKLDVRVFDWIVEYGRYDDLFVFFNTGLEKGMLEYIKIQLRKDAKNFMDKKPISLLAKWLPSINTSSKETREKAKLIKSYLNMTERDYRKMLSDLRNHLDVVEKKCSSNKWEDIKYENVSSQANLKYNSAFLRHDEDRRREYLSKLEKGETKINSSTLFPHDIVSKYTKCSNKDIGLEEMWKALPNYVKGDQSTIVVRDGSGSMMSSIGGTRISALDVATALAIYFAERCKGQFKDKFITFSQKPKLVSFEKYDNLFDKIELAYREAEVANTNIEAVFDLILKTAINNGMSQEEIPNILIISDMEFDSCVTTNAARNSYWDRPKPTKNLFKTIENKYKEAGYKLPKVSFWNTSSRTGTIPVIQNDLGVALISGFSPVVANMVLSDEIDPYKILIKEITKDRYKKITLNPV